MSKIRVDHVFTSESVSEGHPDKVCDQISDAILDACLAQDPDSRVACEVLVTTNFVVIAGEITTAANVDYKAIALEVIRSIGYDDPALGFSVAEAEVLLKLDQQSPDISRGVTAESSLCHEQGAGDQGMMFGFASDDTPELMPATILYAHRIVERLAELRHKFPEKYPYLRPDSKSQVSIRYVDGKPRELETVVVSHQHSPDMPKGVLEKLVREVVAEVVPAELRQGEVAYFINPTGCFEIGGPTGDAGLTGRKIIVDTYGGVGSHGGGAFSGKDPSKVDRSAAYMCRYIAKNIVAAKLAEKCEIQVAYAIGVAEPLSVNIDTYGTGVLENDAMLESIIRREFSLKPAEIIESLGLKNPGKDWSYRDTAAYGHFGRDKFPWEKTDRVDNLRRAADLK